MKLDIITALLFGLTSVFFISFFYAVDTRAGFPVAVLLLTSGTAGYAIRGLIEHRKTHNKIN